MPDQQPTSGPQQQLISPFDIERENERRYMLQCIEKSDSFRSRFVDTWDEVLKNYLVSFDEPKIIFGASNSYFGNLASGRRSRAQSRLKDPETHQIVETLASQGIGLLFSSRDYLKAVPVGSDDPEKARLISRLLMSVLEGPGVFRTLYQVLKDAFIFGTGIIEVGWEECRRQQVVKQPIFDPLTGMPAGMQEGTDEVLYRFGPSLRCLDIYDFYPDPSGTRIQEDMEWVIKRFRISAAQAEYLGKVGTYDPNVVREVLAGTAKRTAQGSERGERQRFPDTTREVPDEYGMVTGFEFWGRVPWLPADGADNRVITLLGDRVVRSRINPFIDGNKPFKEMVLNPIGGRFYGLSPAEVVRYLQDSADNLLMVFNDAADLAAHVPLLVGAAFGGNHNQLRKRSPFDIIQCANPEAVQPVPVDLNALQFAAGDMIRRKMSMREASGATNPMQAIGGGAEKTATETSELIRLASQRVELMIRIIENDDFPWLGSTIHSRLRQYAPPQFIATLQGEQFPISLEQIDVPADVRFVGSRHAKSPYQINSQFDQLLTILSTFPDAAAIYPELLTRKLRDGMGMEDAQQIVQYAQQQLTIKMLMEQMQAAVQMNAEEESVGQASPPKPAAPRSESEASGAQVA